MKTGFSYVYMLRTETDPPHVYTGFTENLDARLAPQLRDRSSHRRPLSVAAGVDRGLCQDPPHSPQIRRPHRRRLQMRLRRLAIRRPRSTIHIPMHKHLRRLNRILIPQAVYFMTTCVRDRMPVLACEQAASILREEWASATTRHGWRIGRYVIMPDHVHFFCAEQAGGARRRLSEFMAFWKEWTAKKLVRSRLIEPPVWQKEFFRSCSAKRRVLRRKMDLCP